MATRTIILECDRDDYRDISAAMAKFTENTIVVGDGNLAGRCIGEICRGWREMRDCSTPELAREVKQAMAFYRAHLIGCDDEEGEQALRRMITSAAAALGVPVPPDLDKVGV